MRMIAEILGCSFQLSILASLEAEKAMVIEEVPPTERELGKLAAKKEMRAIREEKKSNERDLTIGEYVEILEAPVDEELTEEVEEIPEAEAAEAEAGSEAVEVTEEVAEVEAVEAVEVEAVDIDVTEVEEADSRFKKEEIKYSEKSKYFQPIKKRNDLDEDREVGEINPYTGREYQTNSVRTHPKRIGYVQVYDRKEHKWKDMTEWAFIGMEENKKATLGKSYEPPIYLD